MNPECNIIAIWVYTQRLLFIQSGSEPRLQNFNRWVQTHTDSGSERFHVLNIWEKSCPKCAIEDCASLLFCILS